MRRVKDRLASAAAKVRSDDLRAIGEVSADLTADAVREKLLTVVREQLNGDGGDLEDRLIRPSTTDPD